MARRMAMRAAVGAVGAVFLYGAFFLGNLALYLWIADNLGYIHAALILFGAHLVIAGICLMMARSSRPDPIEMEAKQVRDRARMQIENAVATAAMVTPLSRALGNRGVVRLGLTALVTRILAAVRG